MHYGGQGPFVSKVGVAVVSSDVNPSAEGQTITFTAFINIL